jgi:hypothetical protein
VLAEPPLEIEVIELLAPQHARQCLPVHPPLVVGEGSRRDRAVELVGISDPALEHGVEVAERVRRLG